MSRASSTAAQIKEFSLTQGLRPGDPLPTEAELCTLLGVSRGSVREAVRTLATLDIVEVRHGHGTFVGQMSLDALVEALVFRGVLSPGDDLQALREVLEVRQALDLAVAENVAAVFAGTSNPEIAALVTAMNDLAERGLPFMDQDRQFHALMLSRIDNSLVAQLVTAFWDVHTAVLPRLGVQVPEDIAQTVHAHGEMLAAAEAGDVESLRRSIIDHYAPLRRVLYPDSAPEPA
jgi:DNA-binding FadR family transcriptional regulator